MNIKHRIYARKIVLSYLYQYCFFVNLLKQDKVLTESLFIDYIFKTDNKLYEDAKIKLMSQIQESIHVYTPEEFQEFIACFFDERTMQEIDFDYVLSV